MAAKEKAMSWSDRNKNPGNPDDAWKSIHPLNSANELKKNRSDSGDFSALYTPPSGSQKKIYDDFVPFITADGDSAKITGNADDTEMEDKTAAEDGEPVSQAPAISEEELVAIKEAASAEGFEKGYAEGLEKGQKDGFPKGEAEGKIKGEANGFAEGLKKSEVHIERLETIAFSMDTAYADILKKNETFIIDLICHAVEKIVYGTLVIDRSIVKRAVMEAFSLIPEPVEVTVRINTEDYEFIEQIKDDFFKKISSLKQITVMADPGIKTGGCQIECAAGEVEMNLEKRLESIKKKIIELS